ncbi:hypothetical protein PVK06_035854 [Gossypium arboreum]|uniref:Uncharacterized protein n=1 Tax=Gossypium arboreum TaxID=29729 RepID=A0ABR0NHW8_GOSAR|nr:hypothetical protein PVK06_035854 [Gossypium arboreum]
METFCFLTLNLPPKGYGGAREWCLQRHGVARQHGVTRGSPFNGGDDLGHSRWQNTKHQVAESTERIGKPFAILVK